MEAEKWRDWIARLENIRDKGLKETENPFDRDRYQALDRLILEMKSTLPKSYKKLPKIFDSLPYESTPKAGVRTAVIEGDKILLVKEGREGRWVLPGGWADDYSSPAENAVKECFEEAGIKCIPRKIVSVFSGKSPGRSFCPIIRITFLATPIKMESWSFLKNLETDDARFFERDHLPNLFSGKTSREIIDLCFDSYQNERMPTLFDEIYEPIQ